MKKLCFGVVVCSLLLSACASPCRKHSKLLDVTRHQNKVLAALKTEREKRGPLKSKIESDKVLVASEERLLLAIETLMTSNKTVLKSLTKDKD